MQDLQPENLRYLHALASRNGCTLIEDRRGFDIQPLVERRDLKPHILAQGVAVLLKQAGMPDETHPISAYGCKLITADANITLSYFDSPGFKAIGYIANSQFVMHVLIGGGPIKSPQIWANHEAMQKNRFKFQLFRSTLPGQDFGMLYNTFYLNI